MLLPYLNPMEIYMQYYSVCMKYCYLRAHIHVIGVQFIFGQGYIKNLELYFT